MTTAGEDGGSSIAVEKESTSSRGREGPSSQKKKRRTRRPSASSPLRRHKTPRHRRGLRSDVSSSRCSDGSPSTDTATGATEVGHVPSLTASGQGTTVPPSGNVSQQGEPFSLPQDGKAEVDERHDRVVGAVVPCVRSTPENCEPSTTVQAVSDIDSAQTGVVVVDYGAPATYPVTSHSSQTLKEASVDVHHKPAPIQFRGVDESKAGLPETSVALHQLQPSRGSEPLGHTLPAHNSNPQALTGPAKANNDDVKGLIEGRDAVPAPKYFAAIPDAAETDAVVTLSADALPLVASPARAALAAGVSGPPFDVSTDKPAPRRDASASKPTSPNRRTRLLRYSLVEMVASGTSAGRQQLLVVAAVAAAASLLFLVVSGLLLVLLMRISVTYNGAGGSDSCRGRSDCHQHKALIASRVNRSIDPCQDFSAHVCSAWSAPEFREFASTQDDVVLSWARRFSNIIDAGARSLPAGLKAVAFYRKCLENTSYKSIATATRQLRQFMAERGIPWPEQTASASVTPLGVLFDLAINWQLPLWFRVHLSTLTGSQSRAVVLTPSGLTLSWEKHHREILGKGAFVAYYMAFVDALDPAENVPHREAQNIRKVGHIEGTVLQELANAEKYRIPPPGSWQFPISEADHYTPSTPSEQWLSEARKNLDVTPAITGTDLLATANGVFLKAVDSLFAHYGQKELLAYLAWFLVQVLAPAADPGLLLAKYGSEERASAHRPLFCAAHVEAVFRVLIISLYAVPRFSASIRNNLDALLRGIRRIAGEKVSALSWLDEASKMRGRVKLDRMNTTLWPAPDLLEESGLARMYLNFSWSNASTFFEAWVENCRALRQRVRADNFDVGMPANLALPLLEYDYLRNNVMVSVQSLSRPVFYGDGTLAMFYGGLGFLYTREMVKALDGEGSRRDYRGALTEEPWMSVTWRNSLMDPEGCLEGASAGGYFPEIPALEISYASLESAFEASETSPSERAAERRLFFLTFCYFLCSRSGVEQHPVAGGDCNKAVANFAPFAETFNCPFGAGMRPKRRCSFFDP